MIELQLNQAEDILKVLSDHFGTEVFKNKAISVLKDLVDKKTKAYEAANAFYNIYIEDRGDDDDLDEFLIEEFRDIADNSDDSGNADPVDELAFLIEKKGIKAVADSMSAVFEIEFPDMG